MADNEIRARDVDRDRAVEFVEDAWVDGQLDVDEYRARMDRLLEARTLAQLEHEVRDLQGRNGVAWSPEPLPAPVPVPVVEPTVPVPVPTAVGSTPAKTDDREVMAGIVVGVLVLIGLLLLFGWKSTDTEDETDSAGWDAPSSVGEVEEWTLFDSDHFDAMIEAATEGFGATGVHELTVTEESAVAVLDTPDGPMRSDYDVNTEEWNGAVAVSGDAASQRPPLAWEAIDPVVVEEAVAGEEAVSLELDQVRLRIASEGEECFRIDARDPQDRDDPARFTCDGDRVD
ncbi:DUF1707 SHOCT-like domain-containing protein [Nocardioides yefusunii]|uniref:DUF1707 domain-containing protein n=1 Tax=Nocardioides yefusunii TaxID=2500546 RepID=A0ABW1R279_9ACTN|nr:DUF1707 domain-containing protein [Nocardioides yefusunii]